MYRVVVEVQVFLHIIRSVNPGVMSVDYATLKGRAQDALSNILLMDGVDTYQTGMGKMYRAQRMESLTHVIEFCDKKLNISSAARLVKPVVETA